jgi:hypothetical protein
MMNWVLTQNFTDFSVLSIWLKNLLLLFFILTSFYLSSYFLFQKGKYKNSSEKFFFRTITGIALFCFASIPFFLFNIYSIYTVTGLLFLPWLMGFILHPIKLKRDLMDFLLLLKQHGAAVLVFAALSYPALLPPFRFDEMGYHLAYIVEFAQHHGIVTDPFMRLPLFTFNWHVVQTGMYLAGGYQLCHFLTCAASLLAALGIYAFLRRLEVRNFIALLAGVSFYFTPLVFRYSMVLYNDVPLMLFLLSSVYSLFILADDKSYVSIFTAVLCCSMFVGMKVVNVVYIPVFIVLLAFWARDARKIIFLFSISFIALSSVWYLRNIIIDGDPVPPTFNYALGKKDLFWSKADYMAISADLMPKNKDGVMRFLKIPWMMITSSEQSPMRDFPVFAYALLLPLVFIYALFNFRRKEFIFWGLSSFAVLVWIGTSYLVRYAHFMALLVIAAAFILNQVYGLAERRNALIKGGTVLVLLFFFFGPSFTSLRYSFGNINVRIPVSDTAVASFATYGHPELILSINELKEMGVEDKARIYLYELTSYKYYFLNKGYAVTGDVVNKFRFKDFNTALKAGSLDSFLNEAGVKALYLDKSCLCAQEGCKAALDSFIAGKTYKQSVDKGSFWIFVF